MDNLDPLDQPFALAAEARPEGVIGQDEHFAARLGAEEEEAGRVAVRELTRGSPATLAKRIGADLADERAIFGDKIEGVLAHRAVGLAPDRHAPLRERNTFLRLQPSPHPRDDHRLPGSLLHRSPLKNEERGTKND